jgi:hypothetical protein
MWFSVANGLKPSVELVQAMDAVDRRSIRDVTRLTRRGKLAPDVSQARLAVALAHQTRQREPTASAYATIAVLIAIFLGIFIVQAVRGEVDSLGIITGACALWITAFTIKGWIRIRNAVKAERLNLEILQATTEPYSPSWSSAQIELPPAALVAVAVFMFFAYGVPFGLFQLIGTEPTRSASSAIAIGAFFGVVMTIFQLTIGRGIAQRRTESKAELTIPSS